MVKSMKIVICFLAGRMGHRRGTTSERDKRREEGVQGSEGNSTRSWSGVFWREQRERGPLSAKRSTIPLAICGASSRGAKLAGRGCRVWWGGWLGYSKTTGRKER